MWCGAHWLGHTHTHTHAGASGDGGWASAHWHTLVKPGTTTRQRDEPDREQSARAHLASRSLKCAHINTHTHSATRWPVGRVCARGIYLLDCEATPRNRDASDFYVHYYVKYVCNERVCMGADALYTRWRTVGDGALGLLFVAKLARPRDLADAHTCTSPIVPACVSTAAHSFPDLVGCARFIKL